MTDWNEQFPELWEAANLPAGDPARQALESQLPQMDTEQRGHWQDILRETDLVYAQMSGTNLPGGLEQRLLEIPGENPQTSAWKDFFTQPVGWKHLAACAVIAAGLLAYIYWPAEGGLHPLDKQLAERIAILAVEDQEKPAALEIASNDHAKVEAALAAHKFGFGAMVPQPSIPMELLGGGVVHFDQTPVTFTRWKNGQTLYTLYQFDPKQAGLPANFITTVETPKKLWHGNYQYQVVIRPGTDQQGTWALVMENAGIADPFPEGCR